jgi:nucleoside-diphosphate-sugar epimerase
VAITGASGQVGTLLAERLGAAGNATVPLNREDDWPTGIADAEVVAHLAGTLQPTGGDSYESANVRTTETVAAAAREAGVKRIVFLSYVGAAEGSANDYLRSKAEAERVLLDSGVPTTVFRCLHIYGPPEHPGPTADAFLVKDRHSVAVPGNGRQRIAPLFIGDVVEAVLNAALDSGAPTGTFELGGPEEMSMDEFVRGLNGGETRIRHLPAPLARILARLSPALKPALMDLLLTDNVTATDPESVAGEFGVSLTPFERAWSGEAAR